jgi:hypothetical protein
VALNLSLRFQRRNGGVANMMIITILMCAILGYQVTMPEIANAKYSFTVYKDNIVRMNTQNGTFEQCNEKFVCKPTELKEAK